MQSLFSIVDTNSSGTFDEFENLRRIIASRVKGNKVGLNVVHVVFECIKKALGAQSKLSSHVTGFFLFTKCLVDGPCTGSHCRWWKNHIHCPP